MIGVGLSVAGWAATLLSGSLRLLQMMKFVALPGPVTVFYYTIRDVTDKATSVAD